MPHHCQTANTKPIELARFARDGTGTRRVGIAAEREVLRGTEAGSVNTTVREDVSAVVANVSNARDTSISVLNCLAAHFPRRLGR